LLSLIHFFFCTLLPFQHYPDYYAVIKDPIDLRTVAQRIQVSEAFKAFFLTIAMGMCTSGAGIMISTMALLSEAVDVIYL